jgi:hypothetical protein
MYDRLLNIFESFLGDSPKGVSSNSQAQFPCCFCESGKPNLECNFQKGVYRSWCCIDESGKLSNLIKKFGNNTLLQEYISEIKYIRESRLYQIQNKDKFIDEDFGEHFLTLPNCCSKIKINNFKHKLAFDYCKSRGITENMINKFNICCTESYCNDWKLKNRIIIPSYDKFNNINYWVGRLYKNNLHQTKYLNPTDISKKNFIFNEHLIQWDGDVRLVEGPFDHLVIPNSGVLLGKVLDTTFQLYEMLMKKAYSITLIPDMDAFNEWLIIGNTLNHGRLKGKIKICTGKIYNKEKEITDASSVFQHYNYKGIYKLLNDTINI